MCVCVCVCVCVSVILYESLKIRMYPTLQMTYTQHMMICMVGGWLEDGGVRFNFKKIEKVKLREYPCI